MDHTLNNYAMLFHKNLDLLPLKLFVLENDTFVLEKVLEMA
jgi:hypothetical protein